ncbi:hypothetical protein M231_07016 [Tremella mesenterica]|uniref:Arrestin C-terminal-like domain-containing protein n=1 Tax=Tremella mesenterica TaxID=5217 RepID=A0A4Q1BCF5_TREME|nr:hypothetical protein M231_07016 [Tremella mesenterica]
MAHPARLSLRAPPHLPFVQGYPGIPASSNPARPAPAVHGTVELRSGSLPLRAKWVRVEIRKYETLPPGFPTSSTTSPMWEHVGEIVTLWQPSGDKEYDTLEPTDFKFSIPLPEDIPPTCEMLKGTGIKYELVAALCYREKGGLFKKETSPILKISEPLRIIKHDLHSAWPIYNLADTRMGTALGGQLTLIVSRPSTAFGPTDRILFTTTLKSTHPKPFKFKGFECTLHEVTTVIPPLSQNTSKRKSKIPPQGLSRSRIVASTRAAVDESVGRGGEKSARVDMAVPVDKLLLTVKNAKIMSMSYELEVKAICDGLGEVRCGGIIYTVGPYARVQAEQAVRDIGHFPPLSMGVPLTPDSSSRPISSGSTQSQIPSASITSNFSPSSSFYASQPLQPTSDHLSPPTNFYPSKIPQPLYPNQPSYPPTQQYSSSQASYSTSNTYLPTTSFPVQSPYQPNQPYPQRQIQGFIPQDRRKSSSTITSTTTTTHDMGPATSGRPYSTLPGMGGRLTFPTPSPAPALQRSPSVPYSMSEESGGHSMLESVQERAQSDMGHGSRENRASVMTTSTQGTFGVWEGGVKGVLEKTAVTQNSPSRPNSTNPSPRPSPGLSRVPPSSWPTAEQEKLSLYSSARSRAAVTQAASGASLDKLGMSSSTDMDHPSEVAPPEYAPPVPPSPIVQQHSSSAGPSNPGSSGGTKPPRMSETYLSAAEEKERQKKAYETAMSRVTSSSFTSSPTSSQQSHQPNTISQISPTKASSSNIQRAQDVQINGHEELIPYDAIPIAGSSTSNGMSGNIPVAGMVDGLSEKEQMRRYYEAREKVEKASKGTSSSLGHGAESPPIASSSKIGSGSPPRVIVVEPFLKETIRPNQTPSQKVRGSQENQKPQDVRGSQESNVSQGVQSGMTGMSEKEQMKRYYQALDRVKQVASPDTQFSPSTLGFNSLPSSNTFVTATSSNSLGTASSPISSIPPTMSTIPTRGNLDVVSSSNNQGQTLSSGSSVAGPSKTSVVGKGTPWASAEEEKEMMRKRFEAATAAVKRVASPPIQSPIFPSFIPALSSIQSSPPAPSFIPASLPASPSFTSAAPASSPSKSSNPVKGNGASPKRNEFVTHSGGSREVFDNDKEGQLDGRWTEETEEIPPPLPARPPREYINLLSP